MTPDMPTPLDKPSWKVRRRVVLATVTFCAGMTLYLAVWGSSDELRETIANGVLFLAGSVIMGYIFGVVWNDKNFYSSQNSGSEYGDSYGDQYDVFETPDDRYGEG